MIKRKWPGILLLLNLGIISGILTGYMKLHYPMVGHDYSFVSTWLETYLYYRSNGLGIQWYAPNFGGGLPAFPNPNNTQFSLVQVLVFIVSPWKAAVISTIMFIFGGGIAGYYFFKRVLGLHWTSSILGTIFFCATGFYMERISVGHLSYQTFPLIAFLVIILFDSSLSKWFGALIFSMVVAIITHQAGFMLIVTFAFSLLIIIPLIYIYRPEIISLKRITSVIILGSIVAFFISASKLEAVYAFMSFFPRHVMDTYLPVGLPTAISGVVLQLLGPMNLVPFMVLGGVNPGMMNNYMDTAFGATFGFWEYDMSMSPVVFGLIILGVISFLRRPKHYSHFFRSDKKWVAWIMLFFFTWLTIEFILARGLIYPFLSRLPILSSLHVNPRYSVALIFPLASLAAIIYDKWVPKWSPKRSVITFLAANILALIPLGSYFLIPNDLQNRSYDITESEKIYAAIHAGNTFDVTAIGDSSISDIQALGRGLSSLRPYDPIFGNNLSDFRPQIKEGSIWEIDAGYYNMNNASGFVFPGANGTSPFERIPVNEKAQLQAFVSHHDPGWNLPRRQQVLNWVSGLSAAGVSVYLVIFSIHGLVLWFRRRRKSIL
jgi:hypothetical protein